MVMEKKNKKLRFVWSFWRLPSQQKRFGVDNQIKKNLIFYAYSLALVKKSYPDAETVIYTDKESEHLFKDLGYTEVRNYPDGAFDGINPYIFTYAKVKALECSEVGDIQLDNDVFIRSTFLDEFLEKDFDVLNQSIEEYNLPNEINALKQSGLADKYPFLIPEYIFNDGIMCFKNKELKDEFCKKYYEVCKAFQETEAFAEINPGTPLQLNTNLEEATMINIVKDAKIVNIYSENYQKNVLDCNYLHLYGAGKYDPVIINFIMYQLSLLDPDLLVKLQALLELPKWKI